MPILVLDFFRRCAQFVVVNCRVKPNYQSFLYKQNIDYNQLQEDHKIDLEVGMSSSLIINKMTRFEKSSNNSTWFRNH